MLRALLHFCMILNCMKLTKPQGVQPSHGGMQSSIFLCLSQARIKWKGCGRKGIRRKNGGVMEVARWLVWRGCAQLDCRCVCLCFLSLHHKIQKIMVGKSTIIGYHPMGAPTCLLFKCAVASARNYKLTSKFDKCIFSWLLLHLSYFYAAQLWPVAARLWLIPIHTTTALHPFNGLWSLSLGLLLQCFDTVGWVIWPIKTRPRYDL